MSHNQPRYPIALYAALRAGAAVTLVNPMLTTGEVVKQLAEADASVLISSARSASTAAEATLAAGSEHHFVLDGKQSGAGLSVVFDIQSLLAGAAALRPTREGQKYAR
jgi:acyl-CoA synthetase (AMP-forming)/AMP-acid ligase II